MKTLKILLVSIVINGCSQHFGPGYSFSLFQNTVNNKLAQAIENNNYKEAKDILKNDTAVRINLQEPFYGQTLLNLSVGNDKPDFVKLLLENNADLTIPDTTGFAPLHTAADLINSRTHSAEIIKTLLQHGANPNTPALINKDANGNTAKHLPLMDAVVNLECTKILLDYGADLYYKDSLDYAVWSSILSHDLNNSESIYVAKYVIIDKKHSPPNPIFYTTPGLIPRDIFFLLKKFKTYGDADKEKAKQEIIDFLQKQKDNK